MLTLRRRGGFLLAGLVVLAGWATWRHLGKSPARRHLLAGDALMQSGQATEASHEWQVAVALDPALVAAHEKLGHAYEASGALALALREYQVVARLAPHREHAYCQLAEASHAGGLADLALRASRYAAQTERKCPRGHRTLGLILVDSQDYKEALAELETARDLDRQNPEAYLLLAQVRLHLDQREAAEVDARLALKLDTSYPGATSFLAHILVQDGAATKLREAEPLLRRTLQSEPSSVNALVDLARLHRLQGDLKAARTELVQALGLRPRHRDAVHQLGEVYALLGDDAKATEFRLRGAELATDDLRLLEIQRELRVRPSDAMLLAEMAAVRARDGDLLEALTYMERAVHVSSNDANLTRRLMALRKEARGVASADDSSGP